MSTLIASDQQSGETVQLRIGFAFVLVRFFYVLTSSFLDGLARLVVVAIPIGVWMVVVRALFPVNPST